MHVGSSALAASPRRSIGERLPWTRLERLAFAALVAGVFVSLIWLVHPWYDPSNDGAMYVLTARSIARGEGYRMLGIPFTVRPPGFAYMIAPILALRGADFLALHLLTSVLGALGVVLLYLIVRPRVGWPLAWLVAAAVWLNPGMQKLCNQTMSDVPGTTLFLGCLWLEGWVARRPSWRRDLLLALAIGAAAYVRTATVILAPCIAVARLLRRYREAPSERAPLGPWLARLVLVPLVAAGLLVPWSIRNRLVAPDPPADQMLLYSYGTGMWHEDMGDPSSPRLSPLEVLERTGVQVPKIVLTLGSRLGAPSPFGIWIPFFALFFVSTVIVFLRRRSAREFWVLATLGVISVYFGFAPRLLLPIYVLALPATVEVLRDGLGALGRRLGRPRVGAPLTAALLVALIAVDFEPHKKWDLIEAEARLFDEIAERIEVQVGPDQVLASERGWHYAVLLDRPVYSLEFAIKRAGGDATAAERVIDRYGIDTVVLSPARVEDRYVLPYFRERYGETLDRLGQVFHVRPGPGKD